MGQFRPDGVPLRQLQALDGDARQPRRREDSIAREKLSRVQHALGDALQRERLHFELVLLF